MAKKYAPLRILLVIDALLLVATILLYLATMDASDFSVLIVLVPIFGMFIVSLIAFLTFVLSTLRHAGGYTLARKLRSIIALGLLSLPALYTVSNFSGSSLLQSLCALYVLSLALEILMSPLRKATAYLFVAARVCIFGIATVEASTLNDDYMVQWAVILGVVLVGANLYRLYRPSKPSAA